MTEDELKKRLKDWAIAVVLFTRKFPREPEFKAVRNQLVRCAAQLPKPITALPAKANQPLILSIT
ncbi:MAG TPA: hypothetical protein PK228_16140 [Saprospiraceae bacterium]|nr:hypothetical protein [Saprospiraceae bacterium]